MNLLFAICTVMMGVVALYLLFFKATRKTYSGFGSWTAGVAIVAAGYLLFALRGIIPLWITVFAGNLSIPLGLLFQLNGIRLFLGFATSRWTYLSVSGVLALALAVFSFHWDSVYWRGFSTSVFMIAIQWYMAALLFRAKVSPPSTFIKAIVSLLVLGGFLPLVRMAWFALPSSASMIWTAQSEFLFFVGFVTVHLGESLSIMMLNAERVESELLQAKEEFRTTLYSIGDAVISTDTEGLTKQMNPVAERLTGWLEPEAKGKVLGEVFQIVEEESRKPSHNPVDRVLSEGLVVGLGNHTVLISRNGTERPIADSAAPIKDENGEITGVVFVFRDQSEERAAQRLLMQEREKAQHYLDIAGVMLVALDTNGHLTLVNRKGCEILGYQEGDVLGKDWFEHFLPEKLRDEVKGVFSKIIDGHLEIDEYLENVVLTSSGEARIIAWHNSILRDQDGSIIGALSSGEDITDRKAMEETLRESEERLNYVLEGSRDGFWDWHIESGEVRRNERWAQMLGYSFEDIAFTVPQWAELVHPEDKDKAWRSITDHLEGRTPQHEYEYRMLTKDGAWKWILDRAKVVERDGNGVPIRMAGTHTDITDRKKAEEALRESEDKHRRILASIEEGYFEVDLAGNMTFCNEPLSRMLGYTNEELIGMNNREYMDANNAKQVYQAFNRVYRTGKPEGGFGWELVRKDGTPMDVEASVSLIKDSEGKPCGFRGVVRDITDRKRTEELLLQSARLRAVADLSSGVAHHFNNLLQIVMASTSLSLADLESGDLSEIKTNLKKMLDAASLGAETVRRLQTFANVRADIAEGEDSVFDIATTAKNAAEFSKPLWKAEPAKKGIKVDLQLDLQDGCLVKGQENEMFEVLVDLIRNAAEALPDGGDIEVKTLREADEVVITVRDTGIGIAEEDLPKVFQPFWSSKGVGIGKGMGLAVTHGLVKRHGGTISVDSKVGAGTTFTIRLPLAQDSVRKPEQSSMSTSGDRLTILVIDDDLNIASLLERICAKSGHRVFKALSGGEGLAIFNKEPVDMVFCDLGMPGMSGWDVGKAIGSICRDKGTSKPPFVLLTGWGGQELESEKIAESGTDAVVAKPIDSPALLATVQEIAERFNIRSRVT